MSSCTRGARCSSCGSRIRNDSGPQRGRFASWRPSGRGVRDGVPRGPTADQVVADSIAGDTIPKWIAANPGHRAPDEAVLDAVETVSGGFSLGVRAFLHDVQGFQGSDWSALAAAEFIVAGVGDNSHQPGFE